MKNDIKKIFLKFTNTRGLVIIFIIGIALLLVPNLFADRNSPEKVTETVLPSGTFDRSAYEKELENRLANILSTVSGVSDVSVMITLADGGETYYARNEKSDEKTSNDSTYSENSIQFEGSLALKSEAGGGQSPVLLKTGTPQVAGVLVVAKGVLNPSVEAAVISAVRAVFNVSLHRVQVLEKA